MHRCQRPEAGNGTPVQLTQVGSISRSTRRHTPCRALVGKSPDQELPSSGPLRRSARSSLSSLGLLETRRPSCRLRGKLPILREAALLIRDALTALLRNFAAFLLAHARKATFFFSFSLFSLSSAMSRSIFVLF